MKLFYTIVFSFLLIPFSHAQKLKQSFDIERGPVFKTKKNSFHYNIVTKADGSFYVMERDGRKDYVIHKFSDKLGLQKSEEYEFKYDKDDQSPELLTVIDSKLLLFTTEESKREKQQKLFVREVNQKTLKEQANFKKIATIDESGDYKSNGFGLRFSPDSSKLLVYNMWDTKAKEPSQINLTVLDVTDGFKVLWTKNYTSDLIDKLEFFQSFQTANDGAVYILSKRYKGKQKEKVDGIVNYYFRINSFANNGNKVTPIELSLDEKYISDIQFTINKRDDIVCSGFYSNVRSTNQNGAFFISIDGRSKIIQTKNFKEFDIDFIVAYERERRAKKTKKKEAKGKNIEFTKFELDNLVLRSDGGIIQIAEEYFVTISNYTDSNGNTRTTYTYHFRDIIVVSISPEGEIEWARKIPKIQASSSPMNPNISYYQTVLDNKIYIFYLDNPQNLLVDEKDKVKGWNPGKKGALLVYEIDIEGFKQKDALLFNAEEKFIAAPAVFTKNMKDEILMFAKDGKKARYYKVKLE